MKIEIKKFLKIAPKHTFVRFGVKMIGIILFVFILSKVGWQELLIILENINIFYFFLSLILIIPIILLRFLKWNVLVNFSKITVPAKTLIKISMKGGFLGFITPGKLGEFYRAKYLVQFSSSSLGKSFFTVLFDRLTNLAGFMFFAFLGGVFVFGSTKFLLFFIAILVCLIILFLFRKWYYNGKIMAWMTKCSHLYFKEKTELIVADFLQEFSRINKKLIFKLFCFEFFYYNFLVLSHYFILISFGLTVPFCYLFAIVALVALAVGLPISILGLGSREASYIFLFSFLGISAVESVSFSLLILFWNILLVMPGAFLFLKTRKHL